MISGRHILTKILLSLALAVWASPCLASGSYSIAILLSSSEEAYLVPANAFKSEVNLETNVFLLDDDLSKNLIIKKELFHSNPGLIFSLGAKAAFLAKIWTKNRQDIPVVFAMVLNWQRYNLFDGQANIAGIASDIAPGTQFVNLKTFVPKIKRIGVVYSPQSTNLVTRAEQISPLLGVELIAEEIQNSRDFRRAFKQMGDKIDGYWVLKDPVIYGLNNMDWLARRCIQNQLVTLGQSHNIVEMGMMFAVNPDVNSIGSQAASIARNILLGNQAPKDIGLMDPLGTEIIINVKTAKRIGLTISQEAMEMATKIVEK